MEHTTPDSVVNGHRYSGPPEEFDGWVGRRLLLRTAAEVLRDAGYRELARQVDIEEKAEYKRLTTFHDGIRV